MSSHTAHFEATAGGMVLTDAILLYRTQNSQGPNSYATVRPDAHAFASIHRVEQQEAGGSIIAAGTPLTRAHLRQWTEALGRAAPLEILPENVLVAHPDLLAWWTPEQIRPAYFDLSDRFSFPGGTDSLKALSARTVVPVPYPAHLFVATRRRLEVYALPDNQRPTAATPLLHSPVLNVYIDGSLCWGNIPQPKSLTVAAIPEYEAALFDSWSTHPNPGQELTVTGKGGLVRLWDNLAARKANRFPVRRLKPFAFDRRQQARRTARITTEPVTLGRLIAARAGR